MEKHHAGPAKGPALKNADYLVWAVNRGKQRHHDREITKLYNARARLRPETRH